MADFLYTIKAHPTTYAGVEFRSRLEATWAAFFDILGFEWKYEPLDLPGWVPDFILEGSVAVEVKPVLKRADFTEEDKLINSGWGGPILLLGANPDPESSGIGWTISTFDSGTSASKKHDMRGNGDYVIYMQDGRADLWYLTESAGGAYHLIDEAWSRASNTTRWKAPR
jgi:hypothetical protein